MQPAERFCTTAVAMMVSAIALAVPRVAGSENAAHDIAEKFAGAARRDEQAVQVRQAADAARRSEIKRKSEQRQREADHGARQRAADEADMLARARTEAEGRRIEKERAQGELERLEREATDQAVLRARELQRAEERRQAELLAADDRARADGEAARQDAGRRHAELAAMQDRREAEGRRLADKMRRALAARAAKMEALRRAEAVEPRTPPAPRVDAGTDGTVGGAAGPIDPARPADSHASSLSRVTILLLMQPGNRGIRRFEKTADPVLCMPGGCYVSAGAASSAVYLPGRQALGAGNTLGARAGACRHSLACVFRNVDLAGGNGYLQPVDLRVLRHDRREGQRVAPDRSCTVWGGSVHCRRGVTARDYRLWVVPETVADAAGPAALEAALDAGLPQPLSARMDSR